MAIAERLALSLVAASAIAYAATPLAIAVANRLQFYDRPAGYKGHALPTPYLGGVATTVAFVLAAVVAAGGGPKTLGLVAGAAVLWALGTLDDRHTVSPALRVAVELALAGIVWRLGLGWTLHAGSGLDLALTCVWVLGVVNAFNLFDNMDGTASTMALVAAAGAALLGVIHKDAWLAAGSAALAGSCLGFLPRNLSRPARIFLGDGGSMPIGFAVAVLVMVAATRSVRAPWEALPLAVLLVGLPALDTTLVIVSRRRRGVPVLAGGRDHLTHRTSRWMPGARAVALALAGVQAVVSVVAVLAAEGGTSFVALAAIVYGLAAMLAIAALETQSLEYMQQTDPAPPGGVGRVPAGGAEQPPPERRPWPADPALALLAIVGLGAGVSPFFFAYYDPSVWVPVGLGIALLCAMGLVARPQRIGTPAALAATGLLALGIWSLSSTAWAESVEGATQSGNLWLAYGALLLLLVKVARTRRRAAALLAAAGIGVIAVALSVLVRLLGSDPGTLFLNGRLNAPLGYINGEGCLFAIGFWLCMAAFETRRALASGVAAGMATLMACLALLSQSRGTALAMAVSLIAVAALAPGRARRVYGLLAIAAGVALAQPDLMGVYRAGAGETVAAAHAAGRAAALAALGVGGAWALLSGGWALAWQDSQHRLRARAAAAWLLAVPLAAALATGVAFSGRIAHDARVQWHAFIHLADNSGAAPSRASSTRALGNSSTPARANSGTPANSRLLSGGGNRYDYWRIAWDVWRAHPLAGVGPGGYSRFYYQRRATAEDIQQPHSLELQALSELGLVDGLILALFVAGVAAGAGRMRRMARTGPVERGLMVGGVGAFAAWLAQTSVDWMHLLPGLTALALIAATALLWPRSDPTHAGAGRDAGRRSGLTGRGGRRRLDWRPVDRAFAVSSACAIATMVVAGASLSRQGLAEIYARRAARELRANPTAALHDANRSLALDSDATQTYYTKAAAQARFDQASAAQATLRQALSREPANFVTWALLGDIATREGRPAAARRDYEHAHWLNPRNLTLDELLSQPSQAR